MQNQTHNWSKIIGISLSDFIMRVGSTKIKFIFLVLLPNLWKGDKDQGEDQKAGEGKQSEHPQDLKTENQLWITEFQKMQS